MSESIQREELESVGTKEKLTYSGCDHGRGTHSAPRVHDRAHLERLVVPRVPQAS